MLLVVIIILLVIFLIYNQPINESFVTGHEEACNELATYRLMLASNISNLRNPNQNIVTTMNEAYYAKNENMKYQHSNTDLCKKYLTFADGDPMKEACKLLASVDKYEFPVLSDIDVYNFNLLKSQYPMYVDLHTLNFYADLMSCPKLSHHVTYDLYGSNCDSNGSNCSSVHLNTLAADAYTGNYSNIKIHKYNDPLQTQTGLDNDINIYRDIGQLNTQQLAYNLERLSPYYISPDVLQYILNFLISQDNLQYLAYDSLLFANAERCAQSNLIHETNASCSQNV